MATRRTKKTTATKILEEVLKPKAEEPAPKKTARTKRKKTAAPTEATGSFVVIDYPQNGDLVSGLVYSIRAGASSDGYVEISIDNGPWQSMRHAEGYWWYDWGYYTPGTHRIAARLQGDDGKTLKKSDTVKVEVV